jgi:hypothetical protein
MQPSTVLMAWVGSTDLRAPTEQAAVGLGPVAQALSARKSDEAVLLSNFPKAPVEAYVRWISSLTSCRVRVERRELSGPTQFGKVYTAAVDIVQGVLGRYGAAVDLTAHLSPGTPAMAAVWIILAKTRFPAELIESSREHGVRTASVPFDISADFLPGLLRRPDEELQNTLRRAAIWTPEATLKAEDIREALVPLPGAAQDGIVGRPLGEGLDLPALLATVARHYLERALDEAAGNKTRAARLVGLRSYQTLTNWMKRYGVTA